MGLNFFLFPTHNNVFGLCINTVHVNFVLKTFHGIGKVEVWSVASPTFCTVNNFCNNYVKVEAVSTQIASPYTARETLMNIFINFSGNFIKFQI